MNTRHHLTPEEVSSPRVNNHYPRLEHLNDIIDDLNVLITAYNGTVIQTYSNSTGITALGTTQGTATQLTAEYNDVTTVGGLDRGVVLPDLSLYNTGTGCRIIVKNSGAYRMKVYPYSGDIINGLAADAPVYLAVGSEMTFVSVSTSQWETAESITTSLIVETLPSTSITLQTSTINLGDTTYGYITCGASSTSIFGGQSTGDDLILQANSTDVSPVITLNGNGTLALTVNGGATIASTQATGNIISGTFSAMTAGNVLDVTLNTTAVAGDTRIINIRDERNVVYTNGYQMLCLTSVGTITGVGPGFCSLATLWYTQAPADTAGEVYGLHVRLPNAGGARNTVQWAGIHVDNSSQIIDIGRVTTVSTSSSTMPSIYIYDTTSAGALITCNEDIYIEPFKNDTAKDVYINGSSALSGSNNGGHVNINGGNATGTGTDGSIYLGATNTSSIEVGIKMGLNSSGYFTVKTKKYTVGWNGHATSDYKLPATADKVAYNLELGLLIPAKARIVDVFAVVVETFTSSAGAMTIVAGLGNATGGTQFAGSSSVLTLNELVQTAAGASFPVAISASTSKVWLTGVTPNQNWDTLTAGNVEIYISYIDISVC